MGLATKDAELQPLVDELVGRFGPHQTMAALIDNESMQAEMLNSPNVAWGFQYKWRDGGIDYRQNWSVIIMPSISIYGDTGSKRPVG